MAGFFFLLHGRIWNARIENKTDRHFLMEQKSRQINRNRPKGISIVK
jgi:hypothetical protein